MATKFAESGSDATQGLEFYTTSLGGSGAAVSSDSSQFVTGLRSIKCLTGTSGQFATFSKAAILQDAGTRISFRARFGTFPNATSLILQCENSGSTRRIGIGITSGGIVQAFYYNGTTFAQIGSNGSTLSTGVWYQYTFCYTVTSASVNEIRIYKNGVLDITITNASIATTFVNAEFGWGINGATNNGISMWMDDLYVDDSNALTDPGNIHVTAKRPNANGTLNEWTTQIGAGGSGYGSGHSPQVNERPISTTNGWSFQNAAKKTEEYSIENAATGDADLTNATIIDSVGWVYAKVGSASTGNIIVKGVATNISVTTSYALYTKIAGSAVYPAGNTDIGMDTNTINQLFSLAECGILVVYIPAVPSVAMRRTLSPLGTRIGSRQARIT